MKVNHDNPSPPHVTNMHGSSIPSPALKLFFVHALDSNGESNDLFISAPHAVIARLLFSNYCEVNEWRPAGKVVMFEVPAPTTQGILRWHDDVKQAHEWQGRYAA